MVCRDYRIELPATATTADLRGQGRGRWPAGDVNRFGGQPFTTTYLAVCMNLMTSLPYSDRPKFRLTML
jgi:hypothetical protein